MFTSTARKLAEPIKFQKLKHHSHVYSIVTAHFVGGVNMSILCGGFFWRTFWNLQQSSNHVAYLSRPLYSHGGLQEWSIFLPCEVIMHCLQSELTEVPRLFLFLKMTYNWYQVWKEQQLTAKAMYTFKYHCSIYIAFLPRLEGLCNAKLVYRVLLGYWKPEMKWKKRF